MSDKNPLDDYLDATAGDRPAGKEKNAARDQKDFELWQTWKQEPSPQNLQPLLKRFEPTFAQKTREWKAPAVNPAAFKADLQRHAIKAFETYDPERGASLSTHVIGRIQKSKRFNTRSQNLAYIPEDKARHIGAIDSAIDELTEELGRPPTHAEIAPKVGITARQVKEIQGLRRADISSSQFSSDPLGYSGSRDREIISLLRPELKEDEQAVYDFLYGKNGKPTVTSTGELARRLGKSPSQISRIKNRIDAVYRKYL